MSDSMTVIYIEKTGHVVAATTRAVDTGEPELEALVGAELPLRPRREAGDDELAVVAPAAILKAKSVALDLAVLSHPLGFVVNGGLLAALPESEVVEASQVSLETVACSVDYNTAGGKPPEEIEVLTIVRGPDPVDDQLRVQSGKIATDQTAATMSLAILPGEAEAAIPNGGETYTVCVAFPGRRIGFFPVTPA